MHQGREWLRFVRTLAVFAVLAVVFDQVAGAVLERLYFRQRSGVLAQTTYILEGVRTPVLVLGSSRALHHYVPEILSRELGLASYNAGRDGQNLLFHAAMLEEILGRYRPRLVLLELGPRELEREPREFDRLDELLPYLGRHPGLRRTVDLRGPFERYKRLSRTYAYNSLVLPVVLHGLGGHTSVARDSGYLPLHGHAPGHGAPRGSVNAWPAKPVDPVKQEALQRVAALARSSGTRLVVVVSPVLALDRAPQSRAELAGLLAREHVEFLDYAEDTAFVDHAELFYDLAHLNDEGARRFTQTIAERLARTP